MTNSMYGVDQGDLAKWLSTFKESPEVHPPCRAAIWTNSLRSSPGTPWSSCW